MGVLILGIDWIFIIEKESVEKQTLSVKILRRDGDHGTERHPSRVRITLRKNFFLPGARVHLLHFLAV